MPCKRTIEFQRRVKRARLVRKDLSETGYDVKTRARVSCEANIWARGSRYSVPQPAGPAPVASSSIPVNCLNEIKPSSSYACAQLIQRTPHESVVNRNSNILKMTLRKRPCKDGGTWTLKDKGEATVSVSLKHQRRKFRCVRSTLAKKNAYERILQNSAKVKAKEESKKQSDTKSPKCKNEMKLLRKKFKLDRIVHVKLERLSKRELSKKLKLNTSVGKRPRGRPPKNSVSGFALHKRKVGRPSLESIALYGAVQKRKVGRPPMSPASKLKSKIRRNALKRHRHSINTSKIRRKRAPAPKLSITELAIAALNEDPKEKKVTDIYNWISNRYPYFDPEDTSWKNAVRHSLTNCPFFEKCEQGPEGRTRPWKINLECTNKWNCYRRESKCRSLPKFPSRKRMRKLLKFQPLLPKASNLNNFAADNDGYREQLIEQTINQHARQYNVTCLKSTTSTLYHEMSDLLLQAESLRPRTEIILPVQDVVGHTDYKNSKVSSSTNKMYNCGKWMQGLELEYEMTHNFQPLTPIHYGDDVPEFEYEQISDDLTNNNVHAPLIKIGLFELVDDPDYAKYFMSHSNTNFV